MHFDNSGEMNRHLAAQSGGVCLLSFSGGKDSLGAWIELERYFSRIVPVYMYLIPDLAFVEREMAYFEDRFETRIIRMPHPSLYRCLRHFIFVPPERCRFIEEFNPVPFDYDDVFSIVKQDAGLPDDTYTAIGVRQEDSLNRWTSIKQHGAANEKRRTFFPIYDWKKDRLLREIRGRGIKLPESYRLFGRSFDGLDYRFLKPIHDHYPDDYQRILEWFPLAELELKRMEYREAYYD